MKKQDIQLIKDIKFKEHIIDPTEILIRFWEHKGLELNDKVKNLMRFFKPESITRIARDIPNPYPNRKLL